MKLTEIKALLEQREIQLTKSLGQNFMHDGNQLRRILEAAQLDKTDRVLEIGAGLGPLTQLLLANAGEVLAMEKDRRLVEILRERFTGVAHFTLLHDDALDYLARQPQDWSGWKMVSNLPFSVASRILMDLAWGQSRPVRIVATLQYEVALRIRARVGHPEYGLLGLLLQLNYEPAGHFRLPAGSFYPKPEVDSACITLVRRSQPPLTAAQEKVYQGLVRDGFSQRRKMMLKLLKNRWSEPQLRQTLADLSISPQVRAEQVTREQFIEMARRLAG